MIDAIDLRRLNVLRMVHEYGTVTAAAEVLHLTPSAVSHQLRQLAREVGMALLEREGRGVRLTPAGVRLVQHADALQAAWEHARSDLAALDEGRVGRLRLSAFTSGVAELLAPAATYLRRVAPEVEVHLTELERTAVGFDLLLADEVDIALVAATTTGPPLDDARFDQQPLLAEPLELLVPAGHHLAGRDEVDLTEAAHERWVLASPATWDCHELAVSACAAAGFAPDVAHRATSMSAVGALVGAGLGVTLQPRLASRSVGAGVVRVPLAGDPPPQRSILTCVRRGSADHPVIATGLRALREIARPAPVRVAAAG